MRKMLTMVVQQPCTLVKKLLNTMLLIIIKGFATDRKLQYRVVGQKLSIGIKEGVLGDNYLTFKMNDTIGLTRRLQICLLHK